MNDKEKQDYLEKYHEQKEHGEPFFPDAIFKDAVVMLLMFLTLAALAYWAGAPLEARADPADSSYTPRPEWYFLFLFQLLKYFPGNLEIIGVVVIPTLAILALFALPFLDRSPRRHFLRRPVVTGITAFMMAGVIFLTILSVREAPPPVEIQRLHCMQRTVQVVTAPRSRLSLALTCMRLSPGAAMKACLPGAQT